MTKEQFRAFEDHCKSSETYEEVTVYESSRVNFNGDLADEFCGEDVVNIRYIKVKGYNKEIQ